MDDSTDEFNELFRGASPNGLPQDVVGELQSISRLHAISPQELFFKWESYCLKMGAEETVLNLDNARALKQNVQESLERESRGKAHMRGTEKRPNPSATPRALGSNRDAFGMYVSWHAQLLDCLDLLLTVKRLDDLVSSTPQDKSAKRKNASDTPARPKPGRSGDFSSPVDTNTPSKVVNGDKSGSLCVQLPVGRVAASLLLTVA